MDDVKTTSTVPDNSPAGDTAEPSQEAETTPVEGQAAPEKGSDVVTERTIPYNRFKEVNDGYKKLQREIAQLKSASEMSRHDPEDMTKVMSHPYVQELQLKVAEHELRTGTADILSRYPTIPQQIAKAILKNPRGYVAPTTTDIPTALLDIEDYIVELAQESVAPAPVAKPFAVAATNSDSSKQGGTTPADIAKILSKPVSDWTEEETNAAKAYGNKVKK